MLAQAVRTPSSPSDIQSNQNQKVENLKHINERMGQAIKKWTRRQLPGEKTISFWRDLSAKPSATPSPSPNQIMYNSRAQQKYAWISSSK